MMKWMISLALSGLLMLNSGMKLAEVVFFFQNRDAIAAISCVERDVPGSCCHGSCQVAATTSALDGAQTPLAPAPRPLAMWQPAPMVDFRWDWLAIWARMFGPVPSV